MRTIGEIRRLRLAALRLECGLTYAEMNERLGRSRRDATLSQIGKAQPNTRSGKTRLMGEDQARAIEVAFKKPTGWLDRDPEFDELLQRLAATGAAAATSPVAMVPGPLSAADILEQMGMLLAASPVARREAIARNLDGWAREGGAEHYRQALLALIISGGTREKRQGRG